MCLTRRVRCPALCLLGLLFFLPHPLWAASSFNQYKKLCNAYLKVINVQERERTEERYVETQGKVTLQKVPYKEIQVTAELIRKPPNTMTDLFNSSKNPYLKICMLPFDADGKAMDRDCQVFHFQSVIKGNVGTASFRLTPNIARHEFQLTQQVPDHGSAIKLWTPDK